MTTATTSQPSTPPIFCELHGLGYGCALCLGTNRDLTGYITAAQHSGGWGVVGEPSSGWPDHTQAAPGSVIDPTYSSRVKWVGEELVITGSKPVDDTVTHSPGLNGCPSSAEWVPMPNQAKAQRAHHYGPRPYWLRKLDFDVLAYLEQQWLSRLQWQADPRLVESPTTAEGLLDAWPGETTIPATTDQRSLIGYRSAARQYTLG